MRRSSDSLLISRLKTATVALLVTAAFSAMLIASAVLPIEGRAAMMISSPFCSPLVIMSNCLNPVARPVTSRLCLYKLSMVPKECWTIWSRDWKPPVSPFSVTFISSASATPSTSSADSLWSAARAMAMEQMPISFRNRLLSLTIRMYSSITGRRGKPSVKLAR
jgi:hypothetical protein